MKVLDIRETIESRLIGEEFTFEGPHGESEMMVEADFTINSVEVEIGDGEVRLEATAYGCFMGRLDEEIEMVLKVGQFLKMEDLDIELEELDGEIEEM